ncbi:hypothetical protein DNL40_02330 [Xylanimonas oleitrophica]|uniref:Head-tail adaptor protein n=1 Tax=Xylanimonas oleitrophica TaxID=2607479 RepID=A0A2W5WVA6_9MICO|nr:DUF6093 family protein [Xylanimonas oleitrophica]PZR55227.1 hypothetical protein DNL40_02330 [Xylanimonas oleitrophica]
MPLDSTRPIHPDWAAHHTATTQGSMNAVVTITQGSTGGGWDPVTGPRPSIPIQTYTGPARITYQALDAGIRDAAGQDVTVREVTVALPRPAAAQAIGARIRVDAVDANGPTALVGREYTVTSAPYSSHALEHVLTAVDEQNNQPGGGG